MRKNCIQAHVALRWPARDAYAAVYCQVWLAVTLKTCRFQDIPQLYDTDEAWIAYESNLGTLRTFHQLSFQVAAMCQLSPLPLMPQFCLS